MRRLGRFICSVVTVGSAQLGPSVPMSGARRQVRTAAPGKSTAKTPACAITLPSAWTSASAIGRERFGAGGGAEGGTIHGRHRGMTGEVSCYTLGLPTSLVTSTALAPQASSRQASR